MLSGAGGNMALLTGDDGAVLVDDQFAPLAPKIRAAIARLTDRPVRFVINTHWHSDHTGGNEALGATGAVIVAHRNTRERMSTRQLVDLFKLEVPPAEPIALPVVTFEQSVRLHLDGEDISVEHVANAHTDSDAVLYFRKSDVVHTGDVFVRGFYPFIDMGTGGSLDGMIAGSAAILARTGPGTRIIPGHGALATRQDLQDYLDMLVTVRERVATAIRDGRTLQQVLAARPTAEFDVRYARAGIAPDAWVQRVYADLARARAR
jgi:glyoxylase-like metal-dependent hydrolase (beta-lactamase superfamily II)